MDWFLSAAATIILEVVLRPLGAVVLRGLTFGRATIAGIEDPPRKLWPLCWREGDSVVFTPAAAQGTGFAMFVLALIVLSIVT